MSASDEQELANENYEEETNEPTGFDEFLYSIAQALRTKRSKDAIASLIEQYAAQVSLIGPRRERALKWSYIFTIVMVACVGGLGYLKIITTETAGALLGAIIGAIFYGRK